LLRQIDRQGEVQFRFDDARSERAAATACDYCRRGQNLTPTGFKKPGWIMVGLYLNQVAG